GPQPNDFPLAGSRPEDQGIRRDAQDRPAQRQIASRPERWRRSFRYMEARPHARHQISTRVFENVHGAGITNIRSLLLIRDNFQAVAFLGASHGDALTVALEIRLLVISAEVGVILRGVECESAGLAGTFPTDESSPQQTRGC